MREIKFRAWYEHDNAMTTVDQIRFDYGDAWIKYPYGYRKLVDLTELKLREYTGVKDKNGKEIYEGDIIKDSFGGKSGVIRYSSYSAAFEITDYEGIHLLSAFNSSTFFEVIGNIYENPELLK